MTPPPPAAPPSTVVTCVQLAPVLGDLDGNVSRAADAIATAVRAGADVVVLPELSTSGYAFDGVDEVRAVAITPDHLAFATWASAAGSAVVVAGFAEAAAGGPLFNSAVVLDASGVLAVYRKAHLWDREGLVFTPGDAEPPVVETAHGRIGVMVCYDLEFPEWVRTAALAGADLLAVPTNWPLWPRPDGERPGEVVNAMAAARLNHLAIACADRSGVERGQEWTCGTSIVDADGWVVAATSEASGTASATLDLTASRDKALTDRADVMADRRPGLYSAVVGRGREDRWGAVSATVPPATTPFALVVRTATDAELNAAGTVAQEAFADDGIGEDEYSEVIADARSRAEVAEVLVALDGQDGQDGTVLGTVTFALHSTPFADVARPGEAEFRMLGVLESARGRGVGAALVDACAARARASGADRLVLSVHEDAAGAHRLYERLGFAREPERDWDPAPGVHLLFCSLDLRAPTP